MLKRLVLNSIRLRLLAVLLAALALSATVLATVAYRNVLTETEALFDYQLRQMALTLRDQGEIAPDQAGALADDQLDFVVQIWSADGRAIFATRAHSALPTRAVLGLAEVTVQGRTWRTYSVATPGRVIQVAQPVAIRQQLAADAALRSVRPLLWLTPLLAAALWWLAAMTLKPLRQLADSVRARDALSLEPLAGSGLPDEVAPLVAALNALLKRLGESFDTQRAFVADAAHELRSPLTALKLQVRLLQRAPDEAARIEAVAALAAGIERAARLVEQLLALARSEPGAVGVAAEPLDLTELVRLAVVDTVPLAQSRGTVFELHADAPVPLRGDAAALTALVRNLADNAVRYSPPGSTVELQVGCVEGRPTLTVDDAGPGIAAADRERVFTRFVRGAAAAGPGGGQAGEPGSGLGLAIVRAVAGRHGAELELADSPAGGLRVSLRFPVQG